MADLLTVKNLKVDFLQKGKAPHRAVLGVDFSIQEGEIIALVGETGSGKSAIAKALLNLFPKHIAALEGEILFEGNNLCTLPEKELNSIRGKKISMIFQDPMTSLNPTMTIGNQIIESYLQTYPSSSKKKALSLAIKLLNDIGVPDATSRIKEYPHTLSGGMRQRVMLAMALITNPKLLIADEPTTALDVTVQASVLSLLKATQKKTNMSILLITHDLSAVAGFCDRVLVMQEGQIVESASIEDLFYRPKHIYTKHLLEIHPKINHTKSSNEVSFKEKAAPLIEVKNLSKEFSVKAGCIRALKKINLSIYQGETLGLVGESGCGKSTLGKILAGLESPTEGSLYLEGHDPFLLSLKEKSKKTQMIFQDPYASLNPKMTVTKILSEAFVIHKIPFSLETITSLLSLVHLPSSFLSRFPHELSGGQRQRIGIARALSLNPKFLVCDEPISALDNITGAQILELLQNLQKSLDLTILFISHDLRAVKSLVSKVCVMYLGQIMEFGNMEDLYENPLHPYTNALISAIPIPDPFLEKNRLKIVLEGEIPSPLKHITGCPFVSRCPLKEPICHKLRPEYREISPGRFIACHLAKANP